MIAALEQVPKEERATVLAAVTASVLPAYEIIDQVRADEGDLFRAPGERVDPLVRDAVLLETRTHLGLRADDESNQSRERVLKYLSDALTHAMREGLDVGAVRARLGQRGAIAPSQYDLRFSPRFSEKRSTFQVSRASAQAAVLGATAYEHLISPDPDPAAKNEVSLFLQWGLELRRGDPYSVLVLASRNGATLEVSDAWRMYHSEITLPTPVSPLGMLRAFVDRFGCDVVIGTAGEPTRFIYQQRVPLAKPLHQHELPPLGMRSPPGAESDAFMIFSLPSVPADSIDVRVAFAVNETEYTAVVKRHLG